MTTALGLTDAPIRPSPPGPSGRAGGVGWASRALGRVWGDRRRRFGIALAIPAIYGLLAGWWTPRGPMTSAAALLALAVSLLVGAVAGLAFRSRWAMLLAPAVFVVAFELARRGTGGTTVARFHLGSFYGLLALATVRGFHGLVALVPMALAASFGAAFARGVVGRTTARGWRATSGRVARRTGSVVVTVGLVVLAVGLARAPRTDVIRGADGRRITGSIAELTKVTIGGHRLGMTIRGVSATAPILLFLAGGPGGTEIGGMRNHLAALEQHFLVVTWDQRGTGTSYDQLDPLSTLTFDNAVRDTVEVTEYLRHRFGSDAAKVYLVGNSYGTLLGVRAVQQRPELYAAFVGTGQMVSVVETDRRIYAGTLAWARANGNTGLVDKLTASGPPPYTDILDYEAALSHMEDVYPYDHTPNDEGAGGFSTNLLADEYSLVDEVHNLAGMIDTLTAVYPGLQGIDFRVDATRLAVPVYVVEGAHEVPGRFDLVTEWFAALQAPSKQLVVFPTSGHRPLFEQPATFVTFMTDTVLAQTRTP